MSICTKACHTLPPLPPGLRLGPPALREASRPQALLGLRAGTHWVSGRPPPHLPTPPTALCSPLVPSPPRAACCPGLRCLCPLGPAGGASPDPASGAWVAVCPLAPRCRSGVGVRRGRRSPWELEAGSTSVVEGWALHTRQGLAPPRAHHSEPQALHPLKGP